jgi:putative MATE family efflux protein
MLKEAFFGTQQNFTEGDLNRAIFLLAIPMVLEMAMESLFGVVDIFFVARLGSNAVATVGLTESLLILVFAVAIGLSMTVTAFVARRTGENDPEGAAQTSVQAILLGFLISAVVAVIGIAYGPALLRLMGAAPPVAANARYTQIMLGGSLVIFQLFLINAIFRGAGDAALAMRTLWLANAINIVLDPCLINGWGPFPRLGVLGAAVATTTGRGIGVLFQLWQLGSGRDRVTIRRRHLRLDFPVLLRLVKVSITGILQFLIATASWMALVRIVSLFGSAAVAGYTIAVRIIVFAILPSWGLSNAAATLVGQNLGAHKPQRAESAVYRTGFYNMLYLAVVSLVFLFLPGLLIAPFTHEPVVVHTAVVGLRIVGVGLTGYAFGMILIQAFNGAGDTVTPTLINFLAFWIAQVPIAYLLATRYSYGPAGAFAASPVADVTLTITALIVFRQGRWKRQAI